MRLYCFVDLNLWDENTIQYQAHGKEYQAIFYVKLSTRALSYKIPDIASTPTSAADVIYSVMTFVWSVS